MRAPGNPATELREAGADGWQVRLDAPCPAAEQMRRDDAMAREAPRAAARIFLWDPPAVSFGFRQFPPAWWDPAGWAASGLEAVERPTGGGMAFHGSDVSFGIVVPRAGGLSLHEALRGACAAVTAACRSVGAPAEGVLEADRSRRVTYCLTEPSPYAVTVGGRKVAGVAARRYPAAWLVQGSILAEAPPGRLLAALPDGVRRSLERRAVALTDCANEPMTARGVAERLAAGWGAWWASGGPEG
ncbi:MAG TPA: hypothetical protein VGB20_05795 [bacterium]